VVCKFFVAFIFLCYCTLSQALALLAKWHEDRASELARLAKMEELEGVVNS
jgi:hypothetical protein